MESETYPLHEVAKDGDHRLMVELLERQKRHGHVAVDHEDGEGITPLGYAVWAGHLETTKLLIEQGAEPYKVDSCGNSCVHYAAGYGHPELPLGRLRACQLNGLLLNLKRSTCDIVEHVGDCLFSG